MAQIHLKGFTIFTEERVVFQYEAWHLGMMLPQSTWNGGFLGKFKQEVLSGYPIEI